jgi:hypothetical protein
MKFMLLPELSPVISWQPSKFEELQDMNRQSNGGNVRDQLHYAFPHNGLCVQHLGLPPICDPNPLISRKTNSARVGRNHRTTRTAQHGLQALLGLSGFQDMHLHCLWHCRVGQVRRPRRLCHKVLHTDRIPQTVQRCENLRPAKHAGDVHVHDGDACVLLEQCEYVPVQAAIGGRGGIGRERHPSGGDICDRKESNHCTLPQT